MSDLIERQAAMDAFRKIAFYHLFKCGEHIGENPREFLIMNVKKAFEVIECLPSIQPEPQWIPVSERLPENKQLCLVTKRGFGKTKVVDIATYSTNLYKIDEREFCAEKGKSGWYYYDNEFGYCQPLGVVAWMPLPEPFREGES